jgi:predicted ribosome quality control (RQC) complex YloA/Tae2 family protein
MNKVTYNNETMTAYLLGTLPEAEAEHFDELSFTDDEFADELQAAEKDLVDAYVHGELADATLERFKTFYLASPIRREKVKFAQTFQEFATKNMAETHEVVSPVIESKPKRTLAGLISNIFTIKRPLLLQWSLALAALALMILGGWLWSENSRLRFQMNDAQARRDAILQRESQLEQREKELQNEIANQRTANSETEKELAEVRQEREKLEQELKKQLEQRPLEQPRQNEEQRAQKQTPPSSSPNRSSIIASFILTPQLRGNNQLQNISIPAKTDSVAIQLELESNDYKSYRVVLQNQSNSQILWRSGKLNPKNKSGNKSLDIRFPAGLLKSQIYSLQVSGITADGTAEIISDYSFKVVR